MDNDMLSSLLKNPGALQNAMKTVSSMLNTSTADSIPDTAAVSDSAPPFSPAGSNSSSKPSDYDPSADLMEHALPMIRSIVQSGQDAIQQEKRTLLNAVKPFVKEDVAKQFDHAMRLVSMAKMAKAALGQINTTSLPNTNDTTIQEEHTVV